MAVMAGAGVCAAANTGVNRSTAANMTRANAKQFQRMVDVAALLVFMVEVDLPIEEVFVKN